MSSVIVRRKGREESLKEMGGLDDYRLPCGATLWNTGAEIKTWESPQTNRSRFSSSRVKPIFATTRRKLYPLSLPFDPLFSIHWAAKNLFYAVHLQKIFGEMKTSLKPISPGILGLEKGWKCPLPMSALNRFCPEVSLYWEMTTLNCQDHDLNERILTARKEAGCEVLATQMSLTFSHQIWTLFRFNMVIPKQRAS